METPEVTRAIAAAVAAAASLDLAADSAIVFQNSNKLALRLTPCDVLARVSHGGQAAAELELERAQQLAGAGCPVGVVEPSVDPLVYTRDGFVVTFWTYYESTAPQVPPVDYAHALEQLHRGMRMVDLASPRYTDRITEAEQVADDPDLSPELEDVDRLLLGTTLRTLRRTIEAYGAEEQLLHGEPHPGNVLSTTFGPLFIDFETSCHGPVEFDLAYAPETVSAHYPQVNEQLLDICRQLVLAMVAAWRWRLGDEFPDSRQWGHRFLDALRAGPPWPTLDAMTRHSEV